MVMRILLMVQIVIVAAVCESGEQACAAEAVPTDPTQAAALTPLLSQAMLDLLQGHSQAVSDALKAHPQLARLWGEMPKGSGWNGPVTLLHAAIAMKQRAIVDELITAGCDLDASSATCGPPLFIADGDLADLLIAKGATRTIFYAAHIGDAVLAASLLKTDRKAAVAVDRQGMTALHWAAEKPSLEVAQLLVEAGASVNAATPEGFTVLREAIGWKDQRASEPARQAMVDWLLLHGTLWDATSAALAGNTKALAPLVVTHPDLLTWSSPILSEKGMQLIHFACLGNHQPTAAWLLEHGQKVTASDASGATPLHYACVQGGAALVSFLLAHGADASVVEHTYNSNPQGWASYFKNQAALDALAAPAPAPAPSDPPKAAKSDF
jgi:ankyrin repeat protein